MTILILKLYASYKVLRTGINWIVYCQRNNQELWIGAISHYSRRSYKAVRVAVTELPPVEPLEENFCETVEQAVEWIIDQNEKALKVDVSSFEESRMSE